MAAGSQSGALLSLSCSPPPTLFQKSHLNHRLSSPPTLVFVPNSNTKPPILRLRTSSYRERPRVVACRNTANSAENHSPDGSTSSSKEAAFDLNLPRRNLIVQFTCNACGERTQRVINRIAYERGTVFVQCAGCLVNHMLVDNLGLVMEYDLREELNGDSDGSKEGLDAM